MSPNNGRKAGGGGDYVPAVEAIDAAEIDAVTAKNGTEEDESGDGVPAVQSGEEMFHLHERHDAQQQSIPGCGDYHQEIEPHGYRRAEFVVEDIRDHIGRVGKEHQPASHHHGGTGGEPAIAPQSAAEAEGNNGQQGIPEIEKVRELPREQEPHDNQA